MKTNSDIQNTEMGLGVPVSEIHRSFIRIQEASTLFCVCEATLREWVKKGIVPAYAPTRRLLLFRVDELEKAMMRFRVGGLR